jgi:hypothetical protein
VDRNGVAHWPGEAERWLGRRPPGWEFAGG